jgi:hypothetical protein
MKGWKEEEEPEPSSEEEPASAPRWTAKDDAYLEREARTLFVAGEAADAIALLGDRGLLFARHELGSLPCLCRKCLAPEAGDADLDGVRFVRDFVVVRRRVLFYWTPAELVSDAKQVRASMRAAVEDRLRAPEVHATEPRQGVNPFTKEPVTFQPRRLRLRVNPLTGKPLP